VVVLYKAFIEILSEPVLTQSVHDNIRIRMHPGISFSISRINLLVLVTRFDWRYRAENLFWKVEKDSSASLKKSVKSAPHFLSNINWVKIGKQEPGTPFSKLLDPCLMQQ
jgi:hypothetical protein